MRAATKRKTKAKVKAKPKTKPKAKAKAKRAAPSFNLENMPLKDLLDLQKQVDLAVHKAQQVERQHLLEKMKVLADESGFTIDELMGGRGKGRGKNKAPSVAKYQNPENPMETWTGRGRKPNWLVNRLKQGATMDDFAI